MQFNVQFLGDASKNCIAWVRGVVQPSDADKPVELFHLDHVALDARGRKARTLSLVSALWTLQEKLGFYIWTSEDRSPENLLLIAESRNFLRLDRGLVLENWSGQLYLEPFNVPEKKMFWFQLDFDKVFAR